MCLPYAGVGTIDALPRDSNLTYAAEREPTAGGFPAHDVERLEQVTACGLLSAVTPLDGGITNRNYRISTPYGDFVVACLTRSRRCSRSIAATST